MSHAGPVRRNSNGGSGNNNNNDDDDHRRKASFDSSGSGGGRQTRLSAPAPNPLFSPVRSESNQSRNHQNRGHRNNEQQQRREQQPHHDRYRDPNRQYHDQGNFSYTGGPPPPPVPRPGSAPPPSLHHAPPPPPPGRRYHHAPPPPSRPSPHHHGPPPPQPHHRTSSGGYVYRGPSPTFHPSHNVRGPSPTFGPAPTIRGPSPTFGPPPTIRSPSPAFGRPPPPGYHRSPSSHRATGGPPPVSRNLLAPPPTTTYLNPPAPSASAVQPFPVAGLGPPPLPVPQPREQPPQHPAGEDDGGPQEQPVSITQSVATPRGPKAPSAKGSGGGGSGKLPRGGGKGHNIDDDGDDYHEVDNKEAPGNKKRRKSTDQKRAKQRRASTGPTVKSTGVSLSIISDDYPDRIVNPLLEIPKPQHNGGPVMGSELITTTELVFHKPDTYPISYMARLLGFDIPVPQAPVDFPSSLNSGDGTTSIDTLPFVSKDNDAFYQVPSGPKIVQTYRKVSNIGDEIDRHTLDYMDPIYSYILTNGFSPKILKSATSARVAKFAAQQKQLSSVHQQVIKGARKVLNLSEDWTFEDWTSFTENSSLVGGGKSVRPRWTLDGTKVFSNPPPQTFGIIALYQGKPVAILKYQFLWYQMVQQKESEMVMVIEGIGNRTNLKETAPSESAGAPAPIATATEKDAPTPGKTENISTVVVAGSGGGDIDATMSSRHSENRMATTEDLRILDSASTKDEPAAPVKSANPVPHVFPVDREETRSDNERSKVNTFIPVAGGTEPIIAKESEMDLPDASERKEVTEFDDAAPEREIPAQNAAEEEVAGNPAVSLDAAGVGEDGPSDSVPGLGSADEVPLSLADTTASPAKGKDAIDEPLPDAELDDSVVLTMLALALEHTRACGVLYGLWDLPRDHLELIRKCFRMAELPLNTDQSGQPLICDVTKCSSHLAFLLMHENKKTGPGARRPDTNCERLLIRFPAIEEAKALFDDNLSEKQRPKRATESTTANVVSGAKGAARQSSVGIRAIAGEDEGLKCFRLGEVGPENEEMKLPAEATAYSHLNILRCFPVAKTSNSAEPERENEILEKLVKKQADLLAAEQSLEPHLRLLLTKIVDERIDYEKLENKQALADEKRVLNENEQMIERRKEMDLARQEQLEKDMNAVCSICDDGEVTPDNQILFCEACNVAIHQRCYGIERIPEGDYYCIPCRYFGRDKMQEDLACRLKENPAATPVTLDPLPLHCELCPVKHGAYIRTQSSKDEPEKPADSKWVHVTCAKWYGLDILDITKPEVVEDVKPLKMYFREKDMQCDVCERKRGAYHNCRFEGCEKWLHVSCARAVRTCRVIHGDTFDGKPVENPWTLMCTEHSDIDPETLEKEPIPKEKLMQVANEFPDDEVPKPPAHEIKPFHKLSSTERAEALACPDFERKILDDLMYKKFAGARCEVCDTMENDGRNLFRCVTCASVVCVSCKLTHDDIVKQGKNQGGEARFFQCAVCKLVTEKEKAAAGEEVIRPKCSLCFQPYGLLLPGHASPINRKSYFKQNPKEFAKSVFAQELWAHYSCAFWLKGLQVNAAEAMVDMSNAIMSNGRGFILQKHRCNLCGLRGGHKIKCYTPRCRARCEKSIAPHFHVSCARQAGLEVNHSDEYDGEFYAHCYIHGGNEFNLRARIEDLMEVEKLRIGNKMTRKENPMNWVHASRLLNQSIVVVRILGWSWRWAEWWVEYESNWEPLLEPGQKEKDMTKQELKIVDSTQESRCDDARKCRLSAFGAALRNRNYDIDNGFDNESLDHAIRAVLHIPSLVGPLTAVEIDFLADWLGRAYRSKSKKLGLGDDKIPVANEAFCIHIDDKTPKYELGDRPLPGKSTLRDGQIFETDVTEPDDYLKDEIGEDGTPITAPPLEIVKKKAQYKKSVEESSKRKRLRAEDESEAPGPSKRGRPSKANNIVQSSSAEKNSSVSSLAPDAVKNRRGVSSPKRPETVWAVTRKERNELRTNGGFLDATIVWAELTNPEGSLFYGRRGRPPRMWDLSVALKVDGRHFYAEDASEIEFDEHVEGSAGEETREIDISRKSVATSHDAFGTAGKSDSAICATELKDDNDLEINVKGAIADSGSRDALEEAGMPQAQKAFVDITSDEAKEKPAEVSPPKKKRGRPPKSSKSPARPRPHGRPRQSPPKDLEDNTASAANMALAERPKRCSKQVVPFAVASYNESLKEQQRSELRKSFNKETTQEDSETDDDEKEILSSQRGSKKNRRGRPKKGRPRKEDGEGSEGEVGAEDVDQESKNRKRRSPGRPRKHERRASKKARAEIEATFKEVDQHDKDWVDNDVDKREEHSKVLQKSRDNDELLDASTTRSKRGKRDKNRDNDPEAAEKVELVCSDRNAEAYATESLSELKLEANLEFPTHPKRRAFLLRTRSPEKRSSRRFIEEEELAEEEPSKRSLAKGRGRPRSPVKKQSTRTASDTPKKKLSPKTTSEKQSPAESTAIQKSDFSEEMELESEFSILQDGGRKPFLRRTLSPEKPPKKRFNLVHDRPPSLGSLGQGDDDVPREHLAIEEQLGQEARAKEASSDAATEVESDHPTIKKNDDPPAVSTEGGRPPPRRGPRRSGRAH